MFNKSKYTKLYYKIIHLSTEKNRVKSKEIYYENHHIIPKSLGGKNDKANLVLLTPREHFIVHWLLTKMLDDKTQTRKMHSAFYRLSHASKFNSDRKLTPKQYAICKLSNAKAQLGKKQSMETRQKRSKSITESWKNADARKKELSIRSSKENTGVPKPKKTKDKISKKLLGVKHPEWRNKKKSERQKQTYQITKNTGEIILIHGLKEWANNNGYNDVGILNLIAGRIKSHKDIVFAKKLI